MSHRAICPAQRNKKRFVSQCDLCALVNGHIFYTVILKMSVPDLAPDDDDDDP